MKNFTLNDLKGIKKVTDEIITDNSLLELLNTGTELKHYIGYEISGKPHLGTGISSMQVIRELQKLGVHCTILLADWHSWINDKFGGDLDFIKNIGTPYFIEVMNAAAKCVGVDMTKVDFIKASDLVKDDKYWAILVDVAKNTTLSRIQRAIDIMGRKEGETTDFAKLLYPCMQVTDIFYMKTHVMHGGLDQRKAHVIAIDTALAVKNPPFVINGKAYKPVAVHQHLLMGLTPPDKELLKQYHETGVMPVDMKMSKSKPGTAVFMNDSEQEVNDKIMKAYCPEGEVKLNPILDWAKFLCFDLGTKRLDIKRKAEWGGDKTYVKYSELEDDFKSKRLHPMDLKEAVARSINEILKPAREHLNTPKIQELAKKIAEKTSR